ncbi:MAG: hypothetical protein IJZ22_02510 [Bacteroidaceae bacterium]|nr:hypothetical protein [Bacteroidaceae bacterium]
MDTINKARYILNILFLIAAVITFIAYFAASGSSLFLYTGLAAITFKMIEFILRFMF